MLNGRVFIVFACVLAAAATLTSALAADALPAVERQVLLKEKTEIASQSVCLSDLTDDGWVRNRCAVERAACCVWSMGGSLTKVFSREQLHRDIAKMKLGPFMLVLGGPTEIAVAQTRRELTVNELKNKIIETIAAKLGDEPKNIVVDSLNLHAPIYIPIDGGAQWDVLAPEAVADRMTIKVVDTANAGQTLGWAQTVVRQNADVFVAKKTIRPNDPIQIQDFDLRRTNILSPQASGQAVYRDGQFPENVRAKFSMLSGAPLTAAHIERQPTVRLGDTVTLILRSDSLRISTKGVVQSTAAVGDMVTVQLQRYNRTFRGRLVEGRLVEVWL